jgi:hypothetical protein
MRTREMTDQQEVFTLHVGFSDMLSLGEPPWNG